MGGKKRKTPAIWDPAAEVSIRCSGPVLMLVLLVLLAH